MLAGLMRRKLARQLHEVALLLRAAPETLRSTGEALQIGKAAGSQARRSGQARERVGSWSTSLGAAAAAALASTAYAFAQARQLDPEALEDLAKALNGSHYADRETSVASISGLTIYLEHHEALLKAGILPALMEAIQNPRSVSQLRNVALTSTADLMKNPEAHEAVSSSPEFLTVVVQALKAEDRWAEGPEDGGMARTQAARLLGELAAAPDMHPLLVKSGAASALAQSGSLLAHASMKEDKTYSDISAVPGNMGELLEVEEERFTAAALFGLASSDTGVKAVLQTDDADAVNGMSKWARSNDPILQRYGTGALARVAVSGSKAFNAVDAADGIAALITALTSSDGQTACYASGAIGKLPGLGKTPASIALRRGAAPQLVKMLQGAHIKQSAGVKMGVQRCALHAVVLCLEDSELRSALQEAQLTKTIKVLLEDESFAGNSDLASLSTDALKFLGDL